MAFTLTRIEGSDFPHKLDLFCCQKLITLLFIARNQETVPRESECGKRGARERNS